MVELLFWRHMRSLIVHNPYNSYTTSSSSIRCSLHSFIVTTSTIELITGRL